MAHESDVESRPIVVGVDGSAASKAALRWAVEEAERRGCRVDAITAWHQDYGIVIGAVPSTVWATYMPNEVPDAPRRLLDEAVDAVSTTVDVRRAVVVGDAREVLTGASRGAELLVVGSHGAGRMAELFLGSVSGHCARHAQCPVVVIREPAHDRNATAIFGGVDVANEPS